ncbi:MAG: hypothetical protein WC379_16955 [Methanoregula sp.]
MREEMFAPQHKVVFLSRDAGAHHAASPGCADRVLLSLTHPLPAPAAVPRKGS